MRNLHFPVLQLHGILYIIERRGIHLIFAKNKRIFFFKLSLPLLAHSCENGPYGRSWKNKKVLDFQYKVLHRVVALNPLLFKMGIKDNDKCTFCNDEKETICTTHVI